MTEGMLIIAAILFVSGIFALVIVLSHQKLGIEHRRRVLHKQTSGGVIGWIQFRGPFISLRVYEEFIVIGCGKKYVLRYQEIERVEIKKWMGAISNRVKIIHHNSTVPSRILLGTGNPTAIKALIEARLRR